MSALASKTSALIARLRDGISTRNLSDEAATMNRAATEIERLRAALRDLLPFVIQQPSPDWVTPEYRAAVEAAKAALEEQP